MLFKIILNPLLILLLTTHCVSGQAKQTALLPFTAGSYQQILTNNLNKPFMLVVWSITCSSCLKDMALLNSIHKSKPGLKIVMLTTDDLSASDQIQTILEKNQLTEIENWIYAEDNTQKLQYEIDPKWYGELPRTYFLDKSHQRIGVSGVLSQEDYENQFSKMQP